MDDETLIRQLRNTIAWLRRRLRAAEDELRRLKDEKAA